MKKFIALFIVLVLIMASSTSAFSATQSMSADVSLGIVNVQIPVLSSSKILFLVEKDGIRYTYPIVDTDVNQFPLQLGNGDYTVRLMQNTEGNKYKELSKTSVNLSLDDDTSVFLNSIQDIEWNDDLKAIVKAQELTKYSKTDEQKIKAIYTYITKNYKYDYAKARTVTSGYFPNVDQIFTAKMGICYDYASLFAAMLRSVDVPTKLVKGYSTATKSVYHAWNEVYVNGSWKIIDTTYDAAYIQAGRTVYMYKAASNYKTEKMY